MSPQDRKTLKNYFSDGALPTSQHYSDLVDSMVTWKDDGFDKSRREGWRISSLGEERSLMSFYNGVGASEPAWTVGHGTAGGTLEFRPVDTKSPDARSGEVRPVGLALTRDGRMGVHTGDPGWRLDVNGVARMHGRIGVARSVEQASVPADGNWHDITDPMDGCNALEVTAGVGGKVGDGHYALLHAVALNAYNPRNALLNWLFGRKSIRCQNALFGGYADRLRLRWETVFDAKAQADATGARAAQKRSERRFNRPYKLQIRTNAHYGDALQIRYYVTRLWFDSQMQGSRDATVDRDQGVT